MLQLLASSVPRLYDKGKLAPLGQPPLSKEEEIRGFAWWEELTSPLPQLQSTKIVSMGHDPIIRSKIESNGCHVEAP